MKLIKISGVVVALGFAVLCLFLYNQEHPSTHELETTTTQIGEISQLTESTPLLFIGDIMLGRYVEKAVNERGQNYLFGNGIDELLKSHITIANLEGPIPERHVTTPINGFQFSFPTTTPVILKEHGIQAVSLANNHSLDWGMNGYTNTRKVLDDGGIKHFGGYHTTTDDYFETKIGTTSVIIFGINVISNTWNEPRALDIAKKLQTEYPDSILISFMHWGNEYDHGQGDTQRRLAHKLIDNGVDIIVGGHPHVVQGIEVYNNKPIFYSLGNFIFDQYFSQETQEGYTLSFTIKDNKMSFMVIPVMSNRSKVSIATGTVSNFILKTIASNSSSFIAKDIQANGTITIPR